MILFYLMKTYYIYKLFICKGTRLSTIHNLFKYKTQARLQAYTNKIQFSHLADEAIIKIYSYTNKWNYFIFVILGGIFILISKYSNHSLLFIYLYQICFLIAIIIKWIAITYNFITVHYSNAAFGWRSKQPLIPLSASPGVLAKHCLFFLFFLEDATGLVDLKKRAVLPLPDSGGAEIKLKLYSIIRYFLLGMLIIYLILLLIVIFNLIYYLFHFIIKILWGKFRSYANNKGLFGDNKAKGYNKPPKKPQNTNIPYPQNKDHKDIKKKASEMKQKILEIQKDKSKQNDLNIDSSSLHNKNTNSFRTIRNNWNHKINIENRQDLSLQDQLNKIKFELEAYKLQKKKFQQSINNIKKGKENFYPDQSKYLWKDYIEVIKHLNFNLESMRKNLKKLARAAVKKPKK
uniref:Uncharacterized protein n=1 Tax=Hirsutella thompsonii TaxID=42368 RepID=A0A3G2ZPC8_HIRTH|nr:hypothetical protein [Hirsutella thompsonii]AYP41279.1 hypothetical protein [Hirsutella thompsonii]AYP41309.1 hypothetical protein [Hirsutella thompsonii]AYP41337.1 hypothetical protein [Hirsutella thompsonii]